MSSISALLQLAAANMEDWEAALQHILRVDCSVLGVERASYWTLRSNPASIFCELGHLAAQGVFERGTSVLATACPGYFAAMRRAQIFLVDERHRGPVADELASYMAARGVVSMMDVPVWLRGKLVGVLCHEHVGAPRTWSDADQEFALGVGQSLTTALEARARTMAEKRERNAAFLAEASWTMTGVLDTEKVADRAVHVAVPTLADVCAFNEVDGDSVQRVAFAAADPSAGPLLEQLARRQPSRMSGALDLSSGRSVLYPVIDERHIRSYALDEADAALLRALALRSMICVPLMIRAQLRGLMVFVSVTRTYMQEDLRLAECFAERVSAATENARLFQSAQQAIRARDDFLSLVSHELSTPLASLLMSAEMLARTAPSSSEAVSRAGQIIVRQARKLDQLVARMIDASDIGSGDISVELERIDLAKLARDTADRYSEAFRVAGGALEVRADAPVYVRADARRLAQVVCTLLDNAMTFGPGKPVELAVRCEGGKAILSVRDQGPGVDPRQVNQVFDRFQRGGISTRSFGGLGLGLYIARGILKAHHGDILLESRPGEGSTFTVELPTECPTGAR